MFLRPQLELAQHHFCHILWVKLSQKAPGDHTGADFFKGDLWRLAASVCPRTRKIFGDKVLQSTLVHAQHPPPALRISKSPPVVASSSGLRPRIVICVRCVWVRLLGSDPCHLKTRGFRKRVT